MNLEGVVIHPLADAFPLMGELELRELAQDIKASGQREPIVIYEDKILDGRNRFLACQMAGVEPMTVEFSPSATSCTPEEYVWSMNVMRRHLRADQKRELIAKLLKNEPEKSDRQIAKRTGSSPSTVGVVRKEKEEIGDVSKLDTRTDTTGREQPSTKPAKAKPSKYRGEVLTLSSKLDDLVGKWSNEGKKDVWFQVDDWEFSVRWTKSPVNRAEETGRTYKAKGSPKIEGGIQTVKWSPKNDGAGDA